jgi:hypothetical protein
MNDVAVMAVRGQDFVLSHVDGLCGDNAYEKGLALAEGLLRGNRPVNMVYLIAPGSTTPTTASSRPWKAGWAGR